MAKEQKVYMPLMIGDWLKGTRGMKAEIRGVYINLLLFQWDNGFIPSDMEELCLIDPELPKVWDKLKVKFIEIEPGKLQNKKNEEVRDFWKKQRKNGELGGRPKKEKPKQNPTNNPKQNPSDNHHNDIDNDIDLPLNKKESDSKNVPRATFSKLELFNELFSDELYLESLNRLHPNKDLPRAFEEMYVHHSNAPNPPVELGEWKQKLNTWLINTKNGTSKKSDAINSRRAAFAAKHGTSSSG
jgi:uncharacterized protein YdaU (DUF1376 family)